MKVLLLHSTYQYKGGEDFVFEQEQLLLKDALCVEKLTFHNKAGLKGGLQFLTSIWNVSAARKITKVIRNFRPDIVHIHNWHFGFGPLTIRAIKKENIPIVITLHNYRLVCPSATLLVKNKIFLDSPSSSFPWKAVFKRAYRNSFIQSFWLAFIVWFHKKIGTWQMPDKYITLTEFARKQFIESVLGVNPEKYTVKGNFIKTPTLENQSRENQFLYVGRLSSEKGIEVLLKAFTKSDMEIRIAGDGPLKKDVMQAATQNKNIRYLGSLNQQQVAVALQKCSALIVPSICFEGMPLIILEAFGQGTPVIASGTGSMSSMIEPGYNGLLFEMGNSHALVNECEYWNNLPAENKNYYGHNALLTYKKHYTPEKNLEQLLEIYKSVLKKDKTEIIETKPLVISA